jgi:hypothetical protein
MNIASLESILLDIARLLNPEWIKPTVSGLHAVRQPEKCSERKRSRPTLWRASHAVAWCRNHRADITVASASCNGPGTATLHT